MKKKHWTQTAAGKRKMSRVQRAAHAKRRSDHGTETQAKAWLAVGYVNGWIDTYAKAVGLDEHDLAQWVGHALLRRTRGQPVGTS